MTRVKDGPFDLDFSEEIAMTRPTVDIREEVAISNSNASVWRTVATYKAAPRAKGGCHGLLEMRNDTWHLLAEGDGHYWTMSIVTPERLMQIAEVALTYADTIGSIVDYKTPSSKNVYPKGVKALPRIVRKGTFVGTVIPRDNMAALFRLKDTETELAAFDVGYLRGFSELLQHAKKYILSTGVTS